MLGICIQYQHNIHKIIYIKPLKLKHFLLLQLYKEITNLIQRLPSDGIH